MHFPKRVVKREKRNLVVVVLDKDDSAIGLSDRTGWVRVGGEHVFAGSWGTGHKAMADLAPQ